MATKKKSAAQTRKYKEDIIFFRMSCVFILACVAVLAILRLNSGKIGLGFWKLCQNPVYIGVLSVLFVLSLVFFFINKKNKKDETVTSFASINYVSVIGYILCCSVYWGNSMSPSATILLIATVCLALLYFIYYIFKKDFFIFSLANLVFAATIWIFDISSLVSALISALMVALSVLLCLGIYTVSKKTDGEKLCLVPCYISFVISVALICFVNLFSVITTLAAAAVMLTQYVLAGIYYTVKFIKEA